MWWWPIWRWFVDGIITPICVTPTSHLKNIHIFPIVFFGKITESRNFDRKSRCSQPNQSPRSADHPSKTNHTHPSNYTDEIQIIKKKTVSFFHLYTCPMVIDLVYCIFLPLKEHRKWRKWFDWLKTAGNNISVCACFFFLLFISFFIQMELSVTFPLM